MNDNQDNLIITHKKNLGITLYFIYYNILIYFSAVYLLNKWLLMNYVLYYCIM